MFRTSMRPAAFFPGWTQDSFAMLTAIRRASLLVSNLAADHLRPRLILVINICKRSPLRRKTMNWFRRTASIAGIQVPNYWMLVLVAVVVIWIIYSFVAH